MLNGYQAVNCHAFVNIMTIKEAIKVRKSVRTFTNQMLGDEGVAALESYLSSLTGPFPGEPLARISVLRPGHGVDVSTFATYGVISGAQLYIALIIDTREGVKADLAGGYMMEHAVLWATAHGWGTCWLGGTMRRARFAKALNLQDYEKIVAVSPVGYAANRKRFADRLFRRVAGSNQRKPFSELFFINDFTHPYPETGIFADAFKAVRLAPSATNKQPWRVLVQNADVYFYAAPDPGFQANDIGIAMAHFDIERGIVAPWSAEGQAPASKWPCFVKASILHNQD